MRRIDDGNAQAAAGQASQPPRFGGMGGDEVGREVPDLRFQFEIGSRVPDRVDAARQQA